MKKCSRQAGALQAESFLNDAFFDMILSNGKKGT